LMWERSRWNHMKSRAYTIKVIQGTETRLHL
jgi:hypothetical protein